MGDDLGLAAASRDPARIDLVVLLGSEWSSLRSVPTRWFRVVKALRDDDRIGSISVVSPPHARRKYLLDPLPALARAEPSWMSDVLAIRAKLPRGTPDGLLDALGSRRLARALHRVLPGQPSTRVVVATHPGWAAVALSIPARRRGFDAYDDWRAGTRPGDSARRAHAGYRRLSRFDAVSAHSAAWASRLREEFGVEATTVGNGVDLSLYLHPGQPPPGLPERPFAVYVGSIEDRVDLDLLEAVARRIPEIAIVVAGPAEPRVARRLATGPLMWIGAVDPERVPGLLNAASVGLVPHVDNASTRSMDPMKVLEYLAAGLPVVGTTVPVPPQAEPHIEFTNAPAAFADAILRALAKGRPGPPKDVLKPLDWSSVANRLVDFHIGPAGLRPSS